MKRLLFFALVAMMFAACSKDAISEQQGIQPIVDEAPEALTVGFEDDKTRIQLNEAQKTVWTNGDLVSVFYRSDANQKWQYTGETGARTADIKRVSTPEATVSLSDIVVVYPYNENYYINPRTCNVQATLPAVQTYLEDSYGLDGNIMISQSEYNNISLKNVCGWLKLQLTGNGEQIKSITVRGNSGEQVAGELYINSADATATLASEAGDAGEDEDENVAGGAGGNLVFEDTVLKEVTLNCVDGVTLGAEATAFYVALPPQTFAKGLTVEVEATDGHIMAKATDKAITIERNHIQPMAAIEFFPTYPIGNEIFYTATTKVEPYNTDEFGATYLSNVWDSETGKGVITFEGDVTKIGNYAFYGYHADCNKLTSVTIPDSVTTIGDYAFWECTSLTSVTIGNRVTTIGEEAFAYCHSLTSVTIGDSVTTIGERAFYYCPSLTSVTIPNSVTTIGEGAFSWCNDLTSVTIPDSVTTIGGMAFENCDSLTSVTIGDSVTTIGVYAFSYCSSLKEFKGKFAAEGGRCLIIDGVLNAFALGCGVTQYTIPDSVTTIGDSAFSECTSLTSVTIPDSVKTIENWAFSYCSSLTIVTIGNGVTAIGEGVFNHCNDLVEFKGKFAADGGRCLIKDNAIIAYANASGTEYTIPDGVTSMEKSAFRGCIDLAEVTIPSSVTSINVNVFLNCYGLLEVYCKSTTPPSAILYSNYWNAFPSGKNLQKIYVPKESVWSYKTAEGWSDYADYIFEEE